MIHATLGPLPGHFGVCLASIWASEGDFGQCWDRFGHMGMTFSHFGLALKALWAHFGVALGSL